jgi:hypothetical protein
MRLSRSERPAPSRLAHTLRLAIALGAPFLVPPSSLEAQGSEVSAQECCLGLLFPVSARSVAIGRAIVARPGPEGVFGNPAGLSSLDTGQVLVHHTTILEAEQANAISILLTPRFVGSLGLSYQLLDYGDQPATDLNGQTTGNLATREHFLVVTFATPIHGGLGGGLNYKLYQFRRDCSGYCGGDEGVATTQAVDIGAQYHPARWPSWQFGASITDFGFRLQVINAPQADRPPTRLHLGAATDVFRMTAADSALSLWVSAELEQPVFAHALPSVGSLGLEFSVSELVFLRAGYRTGSGLGSGPAVGLGINYQRYSFAIGKSFYQSALSGDNSPAQISFGIAF